MTETPLGNPVYKPLTNEQLADIDERCDRFDQELLRGQGTRIEKFIEDAPTSLQDKLLAELLDMELEHLANHGDTPEREAYLLRFPEQKSVVSTVFDRLPSDPPPKIKNFRLLGEIGHGAMGTVWLADQLKPKRQHIALKVIRNELAPRELSSDGWPEHDGLASMEHPNIAQVLGVGTTKEGRPYVAMEYVDGLPITDFCNENRLTIEERLLLFQQVCEAMQYAHQEGFFHQDLKPSNVLVVTSKATNTPKVIDFGFAKFIARDLQLTRETLQPASASVARLVRYMSPEQAELMPPNHPYERNATGTDVYSLGVMLYELLTGTTPLDEETLREEALPEILEIIRERKPLSPSARLSSSSHVLNTIVGDRCRSEPEKLQNMLTGELDRIVMKALAKDQLHRYQTVGDFAGDIKNYLSGNAIPASQTSLWNQMRNLVRRTKNWMRK